MKKHLPVLFGLLLYTFFYSNLYSQTTGTSIDQNSNSFEWIKYGDQYWSVVNAAVETYRDGTPIPFIEDQTVWKDLTIGAWCYYENDSTDDKSYGKLYNWYAVAGIFDEASLNDPSLRKEFSPIGFRVPDNDDWNTFYQYMTSSGYNFDNSTSGNTLAKSLASVQLWNSSDMNGSPGLNKESNNSSLFNAIPVGARGGCCFTDYFYSRGIQTYFWSKNEHDQNNGVCTYIHFEDYKSYFQNNFKTDGYSVRFVSSEKPIYNSNILLNGTVSAENNQIKNVSDPTDSQDAVTKSYLEGIISALKSRIEQLENNSNVNSEAGIPSYVPLSGLLAYYPLDGNGEDKSDYQNHMLRVGEVTYTIGHEGYQSTAANFTNSIDGYFKLPVPSWSHLNALNAGSLSFWVKLDQKFVSNHYFGFGNSFMVKQKHGQGQDFFIGLSDDTTKIMVYLSGVFPQNSSNYIIGNSSLSLDTWYNITVTWSGSNQKLYVNGNLDGALNAGYEGIPDRTDIDFFSIGSATYGTNTSISESDAGAYGSMDNIAFWNRELSEEEVNELYGGN